MGLVTAPTRNRKDLHSSRARPETRERRPKDVLKDAHNSRTVSERRGSQLEGLKSYNIFQLDSTSFRNRARAVHVFQHVFRTSFTSFRFCARGARISVPGHLLPFGLHFGLLSSCPKQGSLWARRSGTHFGASGLPNSAKIYPNLVR